jgi:hypothetical protein
MDNSENIIEELKNVMPEHANIIDADNNPHT